MIFYTMLKINDFGRGWESHYIIGNPINGFKRPAFIRLLKNHILTPFVRFGRMQTIWGSEYAGFIKISAGKTSVDFLSYYIGISQIRTFAVFKNKDGKAWIGRLDGLHEFRETEKRSPTHS